MPAGIEGVSATSASAAIRSQIRDEADALLYVFQM
jgi:hypothetical protein